MPRGAPHQARSAHGRGRFWPTGKATPRTRHRTQFRLALAAAAIVVLALTFLGVEFARSVNTASMLTAPAEQHAEDISAAQVSCLQAMARTALPDGTRVYIGPTWGSAQYRATEQQLIEYITPWLDPVPATEAQWRVSLGKGPCYGLGISVARNR